MNPRIRATRKAKLILLMLLCVFRSLFGTDNSAFAQSWIVTNTTGAPTLSSDYIGQYDLTPSVSTNVPHSSAYDNRDARIFARLRERIVLRGSASATYGGRMVADYDLRAMNGTNTPTTTNREELRLAWQKSLPLLKAGYFRGRILYNQNFSPLDEWITVFASVDRKRMVAMRDAGPIIFSENSGFTWKAIIRPGEYEFTLATTAKGSVLVAVLSLTQENAAAAASVAAARKMAADNWYCVASAADASQLVLTGGPSQSAPALSITRTGEDVIIAWPASFTGFVLQQTADLTASN